jgi:peroxiredoxin
LLGAFLAAGFLFAPGKFLQEVPYDPYMYFDHEEVTLAARAYTHGWDVFHPSKTFIYHYYPEPAKGEKRALHWSDYKDWGKYLVRSRARYNYLLTGARPDKPEYIVEMEKYGLGGERTLKDYEEFSGLDFSNKIASGKALRGDFIADLDRYRGKRAERVMAAGDTLPAFELLDSFGKKHNARALAGEGHCLFCALPGSFDGYMGDFMGLYRKHEKEIEALGVNVIFVAPVQLGELKAFRRRYEIEQPVYADEKHNLFHAFGVPENVVYETPLTFGVSGMLEISGSYTNRNAVNHINDLLREAHVIAPKGRAAAKRS